MARRIIAILMLALTLALTVVPSFAETTMTILTPLDTTTIEEDFTGKDGANFDVDKFISNLEDPNAPEIVLAREYIQHFKVSDPKTWLFVYVYVPNAASVYNAASFEIGQDVDVYGNPASYVANSGKIIDISDCGRFYKFKVDVTNIKEWRDNQRIYVIGKIIMYGSTADIEMDFRRNFRRFLFSGDDRLGNVDCEYEYDKVIDLDTVLKHYRTESSSKGKNWRNDVFYVYFSIPNDCFNKYDNLNSVEYKYKENLFNGCAWDDPDAFSLLNKLYLKGFLDEYDSTVPTLVVNYHQVLDSDMWDTIFNSSGEYNSFPDSEPSLYNSQLCTIRQVDDINKDGVLFSINGNNIGRVIDKCQAGVGSTPGQNRKITNLSDTVSVEALYSDHGKVSKWFLDKLGVSSSVINDIDVTNRCIEKIDASFFDGFDDANTWSKIHMIEAEDMYAFRDFYNKAIAQDRTMYVLRIGVRDYYSDYAKVFVKSGFTTIRTANENCFYFQGTTIYDFNIISFYFEKQGVLFKVLVNDEVQDFDTPVEGPQDNDFDNAKEGIEKWWQGLKKETNNLLDKLKELLKNIAKIIGIALIVVAVVFLFPIIAPFIRAFFRAIKSLFSNLFKRKKNHKDNERDNE